jgi:hypothetical protein
MNEEQFNGSVGEPEGIDPETAGRVDEPEGMDPKTARRYQLARSIEAHEMAHRLLAELRCELATAPMSPEGDFFRGLANFVDLVLEPDSAESAIGNLDELYRRRVVTNPGHAKRWLVAQVIWIAFGRAMELLAKFSAARAGK